MSDTLAEWIVGEANARQWSLREVARRAGTSQTTISRIANGERTNIRRDVAYGLAKAFDTTVEEVMVRAKLLPERGDLLPEVAGWSERLSQLEAGQRALTIRAMELVLAAVEGCSAKPR